MAYIPNPHRYDEMTYNRCGRSGIKLPAVSIGLWHNFGGVDSLENARAMLRTAFDLGITHFDMANNYGPPYGSAEETFGQLYQSDWKPLRDELIISSKAGWDMWPGPYGDLGSRKYLIASIDQSLKRTGLEYFDIFYHHRPDPETPMEESMGALEQIVRSGKALYVGISSYSAGETRRAAEILRGMGIHLLIHQPSYNMFDRWIEDGLTDVLEEEGIGAIVFSPLAQGLLSEKYLGGIPTGSRASRPESALSPQDISPRMLAKVRKLADIARARGQTLPQMALAWDLRLPAVTSVLIGASRPQQIVENVNSLKVSAFSVDELRAIEEALKD